MPGGNQPSPIEHIVVLMLENRSFDHMLGLLPGVNGLLTDGNQINPACYNLADPAQPGSKRYGSVAGAEYAIDRDDIGRQGFGGPGHSFPAATLQVYGSQDPPSQGALTGAAPLSGFIKSYLNELHADVPGVTPTDEEIEVPMAAFKDGQLPVLWQLAREFCVCDQWFSEVPGPTQPNRLFAHAATSTGLTHNVWSLPIQARTIYDEIDKAGHDWAFFYFDLTDSSNFPQLKGRVDRVMQFDSFYEKAGSGALPTYSFLCPRYADAPEGSANSQHAPYDVRYGDDLIADVYEALRTSPLWERTLLIVTYDEHGGFYDHVSPPTTGVSNPDGLTSPTAYDKAQAAQDPAKNGYLVKPAYDFDFRRLGVRVPALLISPWIDKGTVDSTRYQHTSIMATLRDLFGVGSLTARDAEAASFAPLLQRRTSPRTDAPTKLSRPQLPAPPGPEQMQKPLTERQKDLWPMLAHLDGHPDSGTVTVPPPTRAEGHAYIRERIAAHERHHRARRRRAVYEVFVDPAGLYRWRLQSEEAGVIAISGDGFTTQHGAEHQIKQLRELAPFAAERETEYQA